MNTLIEFGKILLPASLVLYAVFLVVRTSIQKEIELKNLEVRGRSIETILPIRLQAYERITLFLERISPQNLLIRLNTPGLDARDFHKMLLDEIRNEYNHNVSQQVYMTEGVWTSVKNAKEDLVVLINDAAQKVSAEATSIDLAKKIFELALERNIDTIGPALSAVKREIQQTF